MASVSVTICTSSNASLNFMRVNGVLQGGFSGVSMPAYTVPAGKRLVLKGAHGASVNGNGEIAFAGGGNVAVVFTHVLGPGVTIRFPSGDAVYLTGFLEDDV